jgi:hypothetical protein
MGSIHMNDIRMTLGLVNLLIAIYQQRPFPARKAVKK